MDDLAKLAAAIPPFEKGGSGKKYRESTSVNQSRETLTLPKKKEPVKKPTSKTDPEERKKLTPQQLLQENLILMFDSQDYFPDVVFLVNKKVGEKKDKKEEEARIYAHKVILR